MRTRPIKRFIERKLQTGQLYLSANHNNEEFIFTTRMGRIIGVIDRGDHYDLHDMHNPDDKPDKPTAQILKGKKPVIRWTDNTGTVRSET